MIRGCRLNYSVVVDGTLQLVAGTSCSSPVAAAILSAVNDARLAIGKSTIGFINPTVRPRFWRLAALRATDVRASVDLHAPVYGRVQRHHDGKQPRLRHGRIRCRPWMGPGHWTGHAELSEAPRVVAGTPIVMTSTHGRWRLIADIVSSNDVADAVYHFLHALIVGRYVSLLYGRLVTRDAIYSLALLMDRSCGPASFLRISSADPILTMPIRASDLSRCPTCPYTYETISGSRITNRSFYLCTVRSSVHRLRSRSVFTYSRVTDQTNK